MPSHDIHTLRLVDYGEHPHTKGLQRVNYAVAQRLERHFNSLRGRLSRRFGGLPVYIGHPDDPDYAGRPGHGDTRAHGWITGLQAQPDALFATVKWSVSGRELVDNAHYKFLSPRWAMKPIGNGVYEPVRLVSVGLTNTPNIPGDAIANEAPAAAAEVSTATLTGAVEPPAAEPEADAASPVARPVAADSAAAEVPPTAAPPAPINAQERAPVAANTAGLNPAPRTLGLGNRRNAFSRCTAIVDAVNARMAETGEDYATAWTNLKRARSDLF